MNDMKDGKDGALVEKDERFLRRWARRKWEADAARDPIPVDEMPPATPPLTDADMPPIDELDGRSDFSMFLSPEVSDQLRRLALRKLFHSPQFGVRDGLDDYDEDYTQFTKLGDVITADMKHRLERELHDRREAQAVETARNRAKPAESPRIANAGDGTQKGRPPADPGAAEPAEPVERLPDDENHRLES